MILYKDFKNNSCKEQYLSYDVAQSPSSVYNGIDPPLNISRQAAQTPYGGVGVP